MIKSDNGNGRKENKLIIPLLVLALLYVVSIFYFHTVEGWTYLDAAYFTTSTISTVGYGDLTPVTDWGKLGSILLTFFGVGLAFYVITHLGALREKAFDTRVRKNIDLIKSFYTVPTDMERRKIAKLKKKLR